MHFDNSDDESVDSHEDEDEKSDRESDDTDVDDSQKRKHSNNEYRKFKRIRNEQRLKKDEYKHMIKSYYGEGSYFGRPITNLMYNLSTLMGRENNDFLW